jgi:hypothetical protein
VPKTTAEEVAPIAPAPPAEAPPVPAGDDAVRQNIENYGNLRLEGFRDTDQGRMVDFTDLRHMGTLTRKVSDMTDPAKFKEAVEGKQAEFVAGKPPEPPPPAAEPAKPEEITPKAGEVPVQPEIAAPGATTEAKPAVEAPMAIELDTGEPKPEAGASSLAVRPETRTPETHGTLTAGFDPSKVARLLGVKPSVQGVKDYIARFGFKVDNVKELENARGPFGQPFLRRPTPRGEFPASLKLPWVDAKTPPPESVTDLGAIQKRISEGLSPGVIFRDVFKNVNNPINDFLEGSQTFFVNQKEGIAFAKKTLSGVKSAGDAVKKRLDPIKEKYFPVYRKLLDITDYDGKRATVKSGREEEAAAIWEQMRPILEERDKAVVDLARAHPDVRIYLWAEGTLPRDVKISFEERTKGKEIATYLNGPVKSALKKIGIPVKEMQIYVPHILEKEDLGDLHLLDNDFIPEGLEFKHREFGTKSWNPSIVESLQSYIPRVSKKIGFHSAVQKWVPFIEDLKGKPELRHYFEQWFKSNFSPQVQGQLTRVVNAGVNVEFFRLIGLSLSAPKAHAFKLAGNLARVPLPVSLQATARTIVGSLNLAARKLGITREKTLVERLATEFINQRAVNQVIDEIPTDKIGGLWQQVRRYSNTVAPVETFENAQDVIASVIATSNKHIEPLTVRQFIWDTISRYNFRGGVDQPLLFRKPGARAFTMFQMTPWKIKEMQYQMIHDTFNGATDVAGDPYAVKLMRYMMIVGTLETIARQNDDSILDYYIHLPFIQRGTGPIEPTSGGYKLVMPKTTSAPVLDLIQGMSQKGIATGLKEHFVGSQVPGTRAPYGGGMFEKGIRIAKGKIPAIYDESVMRYLTSQPSISAVEEQRSFEDLYSREQELRTYMNGYNRALARGEDSTVAEYESDPDFDKKQEEQSILSSTLKDVSAVRNEIQQVANSKELPDETKKSQIEQLRKEIQQIIKESKGDTEQGKPEGDVIEQTEGSYAHG